MKFLFILLIETNNFLMKMMGIGYEMIKGTSILKRGSYTVT